MFKKWYNVSCRYISYIKSEASNIWRTGVWFLKPFGEVMRKSYLQPSKNKFWSKKWNLI